jgi:DNA polymerase-3 subunit delta
VGSLTLSALRKQIAAEKTGPLYMLIGDDDAEKAAVAAEFAEMIDEGLRAFNVDRVFGAEASVDDLLQAAATLPMMASRRIVIVLAAEKLLIPKRETKAAERDQERLEEFIQDPPPHATIVFVCGPLDERRRVVKLLRKQAEIVNCGSIDDAAGAERWVKTRAAQENINLEPGAIRALVERSGLELVRLRAGLERVSLYALGQPKITADDVRQAVPPAPELQEDFGIARAIARNDTKAALRELDLALDAGAPPYFLLGQLRLAAERVSKPRLRGAMVALLETDVALKSSGGDPRALLQRLVVELCGM